MATLVSKDTSGIYVPGEGEAEVTARRTPSFKVFHRGGRSYRVAGQVGPIHYRLDSFDEGEALKEIDLDLVPGTECDFECLTNGYQVQVWNSVQNSVGEAIHYVARFTRAGHWFAMAPIALYWENDRRQRQTIGVLHAGITPVLDNDAQTITWENALGTGLHFRYNLSPDVFSKALVVESLESLPAPTIQDRNTRLVLLLSITWDPTIIPDDARLPAGFLPGELTSDESLFYVWQASLDSPTAFSFKRNDDAPVFWWQTPRAWQSMSMDADPPTVPGLAGYFWEVGMSETDQHYGTKFCLPWADLQAASFPVFIDTTMSEESLTSNSDDATCHGVTYGTSVYCALNGSQLWAGYTSSWWQRPHAMLGLRYTPPIPQGASIDSAYVRFRPDTDQSRNAHWLLFAEDTDDAATFSVGIHEPVDAYNARTTASAEWDIGTTAWSTSYWYWFQNIQSPVQEVVQRPGWSDNNGMVFVIVSVDGSASHEFRNCHSRDDSPSLSPKFGCEYTEAAGPSGWVMVIKPDE